MGYQIDRNRAIVDVDENKTLTAADAGVVQNVVADGVVVSLPATAAGLTFIVRNGGEPAGATAGSGSNKSAEVAVSPVAADQLIGNGFTAADNKDAINTKEDSEVGDEVRLVGNGTTGYVFQDVVGTWEREA